MGLMICSLCCFAFLAVLIFLITHHEMDWFQAPDSVYAAIIFTPLGLGGVCLFIASRLFRATGYR